MLKNQDAETVMQDAREMQADSPAYAGITINHRVHRVHRVRFPGIRGARQPRHSRESGNPVVPAQVGLDRSGR